jgi:hypothetical protein
MQGVETAEPDQSFRIAVDRIKDIVVVCLEGVGAAPGKPEKDALVHPLCIHHVDDFSSAH